MFIEESRVVPRLVLRAVYLCRRVIHAGLVRANAFKDQGRNVDWEGAEYLRCLLDSREENDRQ